MVCARVRKRVRVKVRVMVNPSQELFIEHGLCMV